MRIQPFVPALALLLAALPLGVHGAVIGSDDFESGIIAGQHGGFSWASHGDNVFADTDPVTGRPTVPAHGKHSAGFAYRARPAGSDSTAELRFKLAKPMPEIYLTYEIRVPDNYFHRPERPGNSKWLMLWSNEYEDFAGLSVGWEYWPSSSGDGSSSLAYRWVDQNGRSGHKDYQPFIDPKEHRGKWMTIVEHVKMSSAPGKGDGLIEFWRRVEDGDLEQIHRAEGLVLWPSAGPAGFTHGYLMGWSNSGYSSETTFYLDDFSISDTWPLGPQPQKPNSVRVQ